MPESQVLPASDKASAMGSAPKREEDTTEVIELAKILLALQSAVPPAPSESMTSSPTTAKAPSTPTPTPIASMPGSPVAGPLITSPPMAIPTEKSPASQLLHRPAATPLQSTATPSRPAKESSPTASRSLKRSASDSAKSKDDKSQGNEQERKKRKRVTEEQLSILETIFATDKMPDQKLRLQLAERLNMSSRRVQIWFQNKRAKLKKANQAAAAATVNQASQQPKAQVAPNSPTPNERAVSSSFLPHFAVVPAASASSPASSPATSPSTTSPASNNSSSNNNTTTSGSSCNAASLPSFSFPLSFHSFPAPFPHYTLPLTRPVK